MANDVKWVKLTMDMFDNRMILKTQNPLPKNRQGVFLLCYCIQLLHLADIVLEVAVLEVVFLLGADLTCILNEIINVHGVWLIAVKDSFQASRSVAPRTVFFVDPMPFIGFDLAVHPSALELQLQRLVAEKAMDFIVVVLDRAEKVFAEMKEQRAIATPIAIGSFKIIPLSLDPGVDTLAEPIRREERERGGFVPFVRYVNDLAKLAAACPPRFRALEVKEHSDKYAVGNDRRVAAHHNTSVM